jgi:hypothetical protein
MMGLLAGYLFRDSITDWERIPIYVYIVFKKMFLAFNPANIRLERHKKSKSFY